jgi:ribosomal protein S27AE
VTPPAEASAPPAAPAARVRKFPCPQCGADLVWSPGAERLRCDYCGFTREIAASEDPKVRERPLEEELARPRDLGWGMSRKSWRCQRCGAVETLAPSEATGACAFRGTPAVVEAPPREDLVRPAGVLPFRVARNAALERIRGWLGSLWFQPNDLRGRATLESIRGVYAPAAASAGALSQLRRIRSSTAAKRGRPASGARSGSFSTQSTWAKPLSAAASRQASASSSSPAMTKVHAAL